MTDPERRAKLLVGYLTACALQAQNRAQLAKNAEMANGYLCEGASGTGVARLHEMLRVRGVQLPASEVRGALFGAVTRQAVQQFQIAIGLPASGVLDPATAAALGASADAVRSAPGGSGDTLGGGSPPRADATFSTAADPPSGVGGPASQGDASRGLVESAVRIGLSAGATGSDVERLHRALTAAGFTLESGEFDRHEFGSSTEAALRAFQHERGLPSAGEVDADTLVALIEIEQNIDVSVTDEPPSAGVSSDSHRGSVNASLFDADGEPVVGATVLLFAERVKQPEVQLGASRTGDDGHCSITYERPAPLNLLLRAYADRELIASSGVSFAASAQVDMSLTTAGDGVVRSLSAYATLRKAIASQLGDVQLTSLTEAADTRDLQFLASAAQVSFADVAYLYVAEELGCQHDIRAETFFGLFAEGVPPPLAVALSNLPDAGIDAAFCAQVLTGVLGVSHDALSQALSRAVSANVLPASYSSAQASELALLEPLRVTATGNAGFMQGKTPLNDLLAVSGVPIAVQTAFVTAFAANQGQLEPTWTQLGADTSVSAADLATLKTALTLAELVRGNVPVLKDTLTRLSNGALASIQDLAKLTEAGWVGRITSLDPDATSIPPVLPNETAEQRIARVAKAWTARLAGWYPTTAFAAALSAAKESSLAASKDELVSFLADNPSFDLKTINIDQFVADNKIELSAVALGELKTVQRLFRLAPRHSAVDAMNAAGYSSAQSIYFAGRNNFVSAMSAPLGSALQANVTYARAQMTYATALATYGQFNASFNLRLPVMSPWSVSTGAAPAQQLPDLAALLGSLDYFACTDCQSVYSPAAYLVDLLHYLNGIGASIPTPSGTSQTARAAFLLRRPDVQYVALDCNNSEITVPYIDLVNELLEAVITQTVTEATVINTTGTSAERRAVPQQINIGAYQQTNGTIFPLILPFDLAFAQTQAYIAALGTAAGTGLNRADLLTLFAGPTVSADAATAIAAARLGINPAMLEIIDSADTHPWERWGWPTATPSTVNQPGSWTEVIDPNTHKAYSPTPDSWADALTKVPVLLNATGLSLQQLYQLLEVVWVTESRVSLSVGTTPGTTVLSADTENMTFTGLATDVLDRANRFLRLWPASGLAMWQLDWALTGAPGGQLDDAFVVLLAGAIKAHAQLRIAFQEILSFWLPLETRDVVNHLGDEDTVALSTYSEVFRNPPVLNSAPGIFVPLGTNAISAASAAPNIVITTAAPHGFESGQQVLITAVFSEPSANGTWTIKVDSPTTFTLEAQVPAAPPPGPPPDQTATGVLSGNAIVAGSAEQNAITAALGLSATDTAAILQFTGTSATLSLVTLNVLLQYQRLASALSLSIPDLILWIQLTDMIPVGAAPNIEPDDTLEFCRRLAVLRKTGLAVRDLDYLLRAQSTSQTTLAFTPTQVTATLQAVRDATAKLPAPRTIPVAGASDSSPITITTAQPSGLQTGAQVTIADVQGNTAANGTFSITVQTPTTFTLSGPSANGAWTPGTGTITTNPYDPAVIKTIIVAALTAATGATANVVTPVLTATDVLPLDQATITLLLNQAGGVDPTAFPGLTGAFTAVAKAAALFAALHRTEAEFAFAVENASSFGWLDPGALPLTAIPTSPYPAFEALLRAFALDQRQPARAPKLFDILGLWVAPAAPPANLDTAIAGPTTAIATASSAAPILITTASPHGLSTGAEVTISGVEGNPPANGTFTITVTSPDSFRLDGTTGAGGGTGGTISQPYLAAALNATVADTTAIATALGATPPALTDANRPGSLADIGMLTAIANALDLTHRYGIDGAVLVDLAAAPATAASTNAAMTALQGQYPQGRWLTAVEPVEDRLRQTRRDALVAYLLQPVAPACLAGISPQLLTSDDLYDYFLIDPEMGTERVTTRLLQASLAVQQFVQQCFLNLTFNGITVDMSNPAWPEWSQWRQTYELWQAARIVFLYPENYLLPDVRGDVSPFFTELESDLRQADCDETLAETALQNYLRKLLSVANLQIAAHYNQTQPDGTYVLHVFGQTTTVPPQRFYRTRTGLLPSSGSWSPWQALTLDIGSAQHLLPVVWDSRLYLFWPVFKQQSAAQGSTSIPTTTSGGTSAPPEQFFSVELCLSELSAGQWQPKQTLAQKFYFYMADAKLMSLLAGSWQLDQRLWFTFRAAEDNASNLQIQVYSAYDGFVAQASLAMPEAPLIVTDRMAPPASWIDLSQDPSYARIIQLLTLTGPQLISPPQYGWVGQNLAYLPWEPIASNPDYLAVLCSTTASTLTSPTTAWLMGWMIGGTITVPGQEAQFDATDPFFVAGVAGKGNPPGGIGPVRTYLVQPSFYATTSSQAEILNIANVSQWTTAFTFQTFYHPYARTFLREFEIGGLDALMAMQLDPETVRAAPPFDFTDYAPFSPPVTQPYPGSANPADPGESALDFSTTPWPVPVLPPDGGAFSSYNWELFCHIVRFTSTLLLQNNQFSDALRWLEYIFNPTIQPTPSNPSPQCYWRLAPLNAINGSWFNDQIQQLLTGTAEAAQAGLPQGATGTAILAWQHDPFDANAVASLRISAYGVATLMQYLTTLIAWGDYYYSQYTSETVARAEQLYVLADMILGPRAEMVRLPPGDESATTSYTYASLNGLDPFSNALVNVENLIVAPEAPQSIVDGTVTTPTLPQYPGAGNSPETLLFCIPPNPQLLGYWDQVAQRLANIRAGLNLQGQAVPLPLYGPAINPLQAGEGGLAGVTPPAPIYRFSVYLERALELTKDVQAYGSAILAALEKQDAETLAALRATQEVNIQTMLVDVKTKQVTAAQDEITALENQQAVVQIRYNFYSSQDFMNTWETTAIALQTAALVLNAVAGVLDITAGVANVLPGYQFGVAGFGGSPFVTMNYGGQNVGSAASSWASVSRTLAGILTEGGSIAATVGGYQRRMDDWTLQANLAKAELTQIASQITAAQDRLAVANSELNVQNTQVDNAQAVSDFLTNKFTNAQLYTWMVGQLTTVYAQAYQLAYSLALQAQYAYQYELGSQDTFIEFGYWDSQHQGLTAGDRLLFDLRRIQAQYLAENVRELELTKHISLALTAPLALVTLRETGTCQICLDEELFDDDHPGQYFRRLRSVALTIPCVTAPYKGVNATLTLTSAYVRTAAPDANYPGPFSACSPTDDPAVIPSPIAASGAQTIATSSGQADAGLFEVNLHDERWLPFEGQGAISAWNLVLDPRDNSFDFTTITDVVLHARYSARGGGDQTAANTVRSFYANQKTPTPQSILVGVRSTFPNALYTFFNPGEGASAQTLILPLANAIFPYTHLGNGVAQISSATFYFVLTVSADNYAIPASSSRPAELLTLQPTAFVDPATGESESLSTQVTFQPAVPAPLTLGLSIALADVPAGLATTTAGQTLLDPDKIADILLVLTYSIGSQ